MKKPAAPTKTQAGFFPDPIAANSTACPAKFHGTDNPRELRALALLFAAPQCHAKHLTVRSVAPTAQT